MVTVTEKAAKEISRLIADKNMPESAGVRVSVEGGGCSGLSYKLDFERESGEGERIFESLGVRLFVDLKSYVYLMGTELDYSDGLNGRGFSFSNPNATKTCGCGESFSI